MFDVNDSWFVVIVYNIVLTPVFDSNKTFVTFYSETLLQLSTSFNEGDNPSVTSLCSAS